MRLLVKVRTLYLLSGIACALFWILPVFSEPSTTGLQEYASSGIQRILRTIVPASILLITPWRRSREFFSNPAIFFFVLATVICPLLTMFTFPQFDLAFYLATPVVTSGLILAAMSSLRQKEFQSWLTGFSLMAACFLVLGISRYGLELTYYYGRPRAHMGFIHPTQTSAVVVAASFALTLMQTRKFSSLWFTKIALFFAGIAVFVLLLLANSRNTYIGAIVVALGWLCIRDITTYRVLAKDSQRINLVSLLAAGFPFAIYMAIGLLNSSSPVFNSLNQLSSWRLGIFKSFISEMTRSNIFRLIFGPTDTTLERYEHGNRSLSVVESAYLSYTSNFGLLFAVSMFLALFFMFRSLLIRRQAFGFGALLGCSVFFLFDSQGLTVSNLSVFTLMAVAVRAATYREKFEANPSVKLNESQTTLRTLQPQHR